MSYRTLVLVLLGSFWSVGRWYFERMTDGSDEPLGVLALGACVVFVPWKRLGERVPGKVLWAVIGGLLAYQLFSGHLMPLLRALFAVGILGIIFLNLRAPAGVLGLLALSLPWVATLQFYVGYPLRVLTGEVSRWLLICLGMDVDRSGVTLVWEGLQVVIDRPCAGINMLWFGAFFTYLVASIYRVRLLGCYQLAGICLVAVVGVNILRNTILFFVETGLLDLPGFSHEAIGAVLFFCVIGLLLRLVGRQRQEVVCEL